jgi:hypothetical protein
MVGSDDGCGGGGCWCWGADGCGGAGLLTVVVMAMVVGGGLLMAGLVMSAGDGW